MPPYISQSMDGQPPRPVSNLTPNQLKLQLRQTDSNLILLTHLVHPELFLENKSNKQINLFFIEFSIFSKKKKKTNTPRVQSSFQTSSEETDVRSFLSLEQQCLPPLLPSPPPPPIRAKRTRNDRASQNK